MHLRMAGRGISRQLRDSEQDGGGDCAQDNVYEICATMGAGELARFRIRIAQS